MPRISAETYAKNFVYNMLDKKKKKQLRNVFIQKELAVQNIYDLVDKGNFRTKNPTDEQNSEYKKHGSKLING